MARRDMMLRPLTLLRRCHTAIASLSDALLDDPIFGPDETKALRIQERTRVLPEPKEMTPAHWARHRNTQLPFHNGCKYCLAGRRPNTHHRASKSKRSIPLLCGDYGFLREIIKLAGADPGVLAVTAQVCA